MQKSTERQRQAKPTQRLRVVRACPYSALVAKLRLDDLQYASASESVFEPALETFFRIAAQVPSE